MKKDDTTFPLTYQNAVKLKNDYLHLIGKPYLLLGGKFDDVLVDTIEITECIVNDRKMYIVVFMPDREVKQKEFRKEVIKYILETIPDFDFSVYGLQLLRS
ncbi:hypothetical protein [Ferruginibacter sp.]|nr:hypothetical protein [Ferruginibacter sp.]